MDCMECLELLEMGQATAVLLAVLVASTIAVCAIVKDQREERRFEAMMSALEYYHKAMKKEELRDMPLPRGPRQAH